MCKNTLLLFGKLWHPCRNNIRLPQIHHRNDTNTHKMMYDAASVCEICCVTSLWRKWPLITIISACLEAGVWVCTKCLIRQLSRCTVDMWWMQRLWNFKNYDGEFFCFVHASLCNLIKSQIGPNLQHLHLFLQTYRVHRIASVFTGPLSLLMFMYFIRILFHRPKQSSAHLEKLAK